MLHTFTLYTLTLMYTIYQDIISSLFTLYVTFIVYIGLLTAIADDIEVLYYET